ncbi:MAG: S8 family serine peptidase [Candidatus Brocadiia bacterium]|nr:S8 family serine peptidase [Candidatus Brocadiia bacterium]
MGRPSGSAPGHGIRRAGRPFALVVALALLALAARPGRSVDLLPHADAEKGVLIFVVDSPVDRRFLEGRVAGLTGADITHGSLVARVIRSYSAAPLRSVAAERDGVDLAAYLAGLGEVIAYAAAHPDTRVLANISLGSYDRNPREEALVRQLVAAGVLIAAAAGNDDGDEPFYPAAYSGVVAVASARAGGKSLHSNYGPHIRMAASGDIRFLDYEFLPRRRLRREMEARGTSFAAPRVTATLAYILQRRPNLSPLDALRIIEETTSPINDDLYAEGKLGAGLLDIYRAKSRVSPLHRTLHYVLPIAVMAALALLTAVLCVRYTLRGVFVSLLLWLVGLPTAALIVLEAMVYLEFVGAGNMAAGLRASAVLATGAGLGAFVLRGNLPKIILAGTLAAAVLLAALGTEFLAPLAAAGAASLAGVGCAVLVERRTRRALAGIKALPAAALAPDGEFTVPAAAARLAGACNWAVDRRIKRACVEAVLELPPGEAAEALRTLNRQSTGALELLGEVERLSEGDPPGRPSHDGPEPTDSGA